MEYNFSFDDNKILRVKSKTPIYLSGYQTYKEELQEFDIIHSFRIISLYKEDVDSEGNFYYWYYIDDYFKAIDCSSSLRKENEKLKSKIDYLSMMTDIDIPKEEAEVHGKA